MLKSQIWKIGEKTGLDLGYAKFKIIVRAGKQGGAKEARLKVRSG